MEYIITIVFATLLIGTFIYLLIWLLKGDANTPTWTGIIISAIIGLLPLYLVLCFFGIMGDDPKPKGEE